MTDQTPLTTLQLANIDAAIAAYQRHAPTGFACCTAHPVADAGAGLLAEVRRLQAELAEYEVLSPQQCPKGVHADWLIDSEYGHACPWCQIDDLKATAAAAAGESGSTR